MAEFRALVQDDAQVQGGSPRTNLVRAFRSRETRQAVPGLAAWECQQDDILPTLDQLFQVRAPQVSPSSSGVAASLRADARGAPFTPRNYSSTHHHAEAARGRGL